MIRIHLVAFGRLRTPGLREACDYWLRNARPWARIEEVELKAASLDDKSEGARARAQREEDLRLGEWAERTLPGPADRLILLDERGKAAPTLEWARWIADSGSANLAFALGGAGGWSDAARARAWKVVGLGAQTLSHDLARAVLCEQAYRALSIIQRHPYHHEG